MIARERRRAAAACEQGRGHVDRVAHQVAIFELDQPRVDILGLERRRAELRKIGADVAGVAEILDQPNLGRRVADDMRAGRTVVTFDDQSAGFAGVAAIRVNAAPDSASTAVRRSSGKSSNVAIFGGSFFN